MVDEGVKAFGAIHYCVNNAGVTSTPRARSHELPVAGVGSGAGDQTSRGVWLCQRAEITQMLKQEADLVMKYVSPILLVMGRQRFGDWGVLMECVGGKEPGVPPQRGQYRQHLVYSRSCRQCYEWICESSTRYYFSGLAIWPADTAREW
jgi:hypothetical protein